MKRPNMYCLSLILAAIFLAGDLAGADTSGTIVGKVVDASTGEYLPGAHIVVQGLGLGASCDAEGRFIITGVPAGYHILRATMRGYREERQERVKVAPGRKTTVSFTLRPLLMDMPQIVVSATRRPSNPAKVPSFASTISAKRIEGSGLSNVGKLISSVPGVDIRDYGGISGPVSLSLRGSSPGEVLILVDGVRVNNAQSGEVNLDNLPLNGVERIEVVRGGNSALYGADAVGGIVNIITKDVKAGQVEAWVGAGSFGGLEVGTELQHKWKSGSILLSLSKSEGTGDFRYRDKVGVLRRRVNAAYRKSNLFGKLKLNVVETGLLVFTVESLWSHRGDPGPLGQESSNALMKERMASGRIDFSQTISKDVSYELRVYNRDSRQHYYNPDGYLLIDDTHHVRSLGVELQGNFQLWGRSPFTIGLSYRKDDVSSTNLGDVFRVTKSAYIQDELEWKGGDNPIGLKGITVFPAIRADDYSDFGFNVSPRLGIALVFHDHLGLVLKGNIGRSFQAPTLNDLYWMEDNFAKGNPHLKPERSANFDVGFSFSRNMPLVLRGSVAYFANRFQDKIQWQPGAGGKWSPQNVGTARTRGVELETEVSTSDGRIVAGGSYTYLIAQDNRGRTLLYRPKHSLSYSLSLASRGISLRFEGRAVGRRFYTVANTKWLQPYTIHNIGVRIQGRMMAVDFGIHGRVENIFDVRYQQVADYPLPGRRWSLRVDLSI